MKIDHRLYSDGQPARRTLEESNITRAQNTQNIFAKCASAPKTLVHTPKRYKNTQGIRLTAPGHYQPLNSLCGSGNPGLTLPFKLQEFNSADIADTNAKASKF